MNAHNQGKLELRHRFLVQAVQKSQADDLLFGDPVNVGNCCGELQRTFLKFATHSNRSIGQAEHSAINQVLLCIARIACGGVVHDDTYIEGGTFLAIAGEAAVASAREDDPEMDEAIGESIEQQIAADQAQIEAPAQVES